MFRILDPVFFDPWMWDKFFPDPGSRISGSRIPDLGISDPGSIYLRAWKQFFGGYKCQTLRQLAQIFFCTGAFLKIKQFTLLLNLCLPKKVGCLPKKVGQTKFSACSFLLLLDPGSEVGDPGWKKIRIWISFPDLQLWVSYLVCWLVLENMT